MLVIYTSYVTATVPEFGTKGPELKLDENTRGTGHEGHRNFKVLRKRISNGRHSQSARSSQAY